jgi:hypothetical protein
VTAPNIPMKIGAEKGFLDMHENNFFGLRWA